MLRFIVHVCVRVRNTQRSTNNACETLTYNRAIVRQQFEKVKQLAGSERTDQVGRDGRQVLLGLDDLRHFIQTGKFDGLRLSAVDVGDGSNGRARPQPDGGGAGDDRDRLHGAGASVSRGGRSFRSLQARTSRTRLDARPTVGRGGPRKVVETADENP